MPLPLIPVVAAMAAGGTLVPHAAGGLIVTATAGGYVAGTYLSTAAIASLIAAATAATAGIAIVTGAASAVIGSAGVFGTTIGATGITGFLMSVGILPATPIIVPIAIGTLTIAGLVASAYGSLFLYRLRRKLQAAKEGEEIQFTEREARFIESVIRRMSKKGLI